MGTTFVPGVLTSISQNLINPYTGDMLFVSGNYYVNTQYSNGGPGNQDVLLSSVDNQFFSIEDSQGNLLIEDYETFLMAPGDDILNLASTTYVMGDTTILTADGNDIVWANAGNDFIDGGVGNDILHGGPGNDNILGGGDDDILTGASGNDTIDGGTGYDVSIYYGNYSSYTLNETGGTTTIQDLVGSDGTDTVTNVERFEFLDGYYENNVFTTYNDVFIGTSAIDVFDGGQGFDTVDYSLSNAAILIDLAKNVHVGGYASGDSLISIERVIGSDHGDRIYGDDADNTLEGRNGEDYLHGADGDDMLLGGADDDVIIGGSGADTLYGGADDDVLHGHGLDSAEVQTTLNTVPGVVYNEDLNSFYFVSYASILSASWNNINAFASGFVLNGTTPHMANITSEAEYSYLANISNGEALWLGGTDMAQEGQWVWNSGAEGGSVFYDAGLNNVSLYQNFFMDVPYFETVLGAADTDALLFLEPFGWADYNASESLGFIAEWDAGEMNDDNAVDTLHGGDGDDMLYGYGGNDMLYGDADNDTLFGGRGNDLLEGGFGEDNLYGQSGADTLNGGMGADLLKGGSGADTFVFDAATSFDAVDTVLDYSLVENDVLDVSDLLSGYNPLTDSIVDFVQITDNGTDSFVSVDTSGSASNFVQIATLTNVTGLMDEALLETSGHLLTV